MTIKFEVPGARAPYVFAVYAPDFEYSIRKEQYQLVEQGAFGHCPAGKYGIDKGRPGFGVQAPDIDWSDTCCGMYTKNTKSFCDAPTAKNSTTLLPSRPTWKCRIDEGTRPVLVVARGVLLPQTRSRKPCSSESLTTE